MPLSVLLACYISYNILQRVWVLRHHYYVRSDLDGQGYWVLRPNDKAAANLLAKTRASMSRFIRSLQPRDSIDPTIQQSIHRLHTLFPNGQGLFVAESYDQDSSLAYTLNKDEGFFFCLDHADSQVLLFLAIHELTHAAIETYEMESAQGITIHSDAFKKLERFMYERAATLGMLDYRTLTGRKYCHGTLMNPGTA